MVDVATELRDYFERQGITQAQIAKRLGKSKAQVNAYINGRSSFGKKQAEEWGKEFNIHPEWLRTGVGPMLKKDTPVDDVDKEDKEDNTGARRVNMVPLLPASAFAGSIEGFAPDSVALEQCDMVVSPVPGAEMAIPITGDSMEPDYPDGSVAYIRRINDASFIPWGHTVILDTENGAFIKRIYPDEEDSDYVWARSINPDYPPMHIPRESIYRIFRVIATARIYTTM